MQKLDNKKRKIFSGIVVSDKMDKTVVVRVDEVKLNSKYGKQYKASKKFKVHDQENKYKIGDKINFTESRPLSKDKKWRAI